MKTDQYPNTPSTSRETNAQSRLDWASARFVEEGISVQVAYGTRYAAEFLKTRMINIEVTRRVLLDPTHRRNYTVR